LPLVVESNRFNKQHKKENRAEKESGDEKQPVDHGKPANPSISPPG
jgi:hypothetical protein